jgi:hypothetical protein
VLDFLLCFGLEPRGRSAFSSLSLHVLPLPLERNKVTHPSPVSRSRVGHGVSTIPISDHLEEKGSLARLSPLLGELDRLSDGEDVHTVDLFDAPERKKGGGEAMSERSEEAWEAARRRR